MINSRTNSAGSRRDAAQRALRRLRAEWLHHRSRALAWWGFRYRPRHSRALVQLSLPPAAERLSFEGLGAIVVPAARRLGIGTPGIWLAVQLALRADCFLVIICSKEASANSFAKRLMGRVAQGRLICIDLADIHTGWLPRLSSTEHALSKLHRENDVGAKRNVGLALAAVMGWRSILFLDDDVFASLSGDSAEPTLTAETLSLALDRLRSQPELRIVGWRSKNFDDNSVVGHARTFCKLDQGVFPGSGALLVWCEAVPYFPSMYNEDWFFMIASALRSQQPRAALAVAGSVRQRRYEPFQTKRARGEEAGDVIAEGLMNLLEDHGIGLLHMAESRTFWTRSLMSRQKMLRHMGHIVTGPPQGRSPKRCLAVEQSLNAALGVLAQITPEAILSFLRDWRADHLIWDEHLKALQGCSSSDRKLAIKYFLNSEPPPVGAIVRANRSGERADQNLVMC